MARTSSSLAMARSWQPRGRGDMGSAERERVTRDARARSAGSGGGARRAAATRACRGAGRARSHAAVHVGAGLPGRDRPAVEQHLHRAAAAARPSSARGRRAAPANCDVDRRARAGVAACAADRPGAAEANVVERQPARRRRAVARARPGRAGRRPALRALGAEVGLGRGLARRDDDVLRPRVARAERARPPRASSARIAASVWS